MLLRFFGKNFGVFRDEFSLSMEALNLNNEEDQNRGYFEVPVKGEKEPLKLLRIAAIYGHNASGKSTIIEAVRVLHKLIVHSAPRFQDGEKIAGYKPFLLDENTREAPVTLGCEVVVDDVVMEYSISFTEDEVTEEILKEHQGEKEYVWFMRNGPDSDDINISEKYIKGAISSGFKYNVRKNAAVISTAAMLNQKSFINIFKVLDISLYALNAGFRAVTSMDYSVRNLHKDTDFRTWVLSQILMPADVGIVNVKTQENRIPEDILDNLKQLIPDENIRTPETMVDVILSHKGVGGNYYDLPLEEESDGTQKMLALAGPWYDMINKGKTLFVDELSSSLHPNLLLALLSAFNLPPDAPAAQLIFTAHDTMPMEILRRDQIFFTQKNREGVSELIPLSDFKERKENNIRKRYLEGRFGGVPSSPYFVFSGTRE